GRIEWCARAIYKRFRPDETQRIGPIALEVRDEASRALKLYLVRQKAKTAAYSPGARDANTLMDQATSGAFNFLDVTARTFGPTSEVGARAARLQAALFPRSLKPVVSSSYPEELALVRILLEAARGELAAEVAAVPGFAPVIDLLEERAAHFDAVVEREQKAAGPTYAEYEAAAAEADRLLNDLVNAILFTYRGKAPEAVARRAELLEPYVLQQSQMRDLYRRRLPPADIDPETGEALSKAADELAAPVAKGPIVV
ncbi:MAG: hypothetical protein H5U40_08805, partial [Polyangiaceae bacterium]|nr:hypothetical protein [Polyangiaceae bacterium]